MIRCGLVALILSCVGVDLAMAQALKFDALEKTFYGRFGESNAIYSFFVTNRSENDIVLQTVVPSCGCTSARVPPLPWIIAPGEGGELAFNMDVAGKRGQVSKGVAIRSSVGNFDLLLRVNLPDDPEGSREANQLLAQKNRQIVLQGECAACHVTPGIGKFGKDLYEVACDICHSQDRRASFVPNLHAFAAKGTEGYWRTLIVHGVTNTLMPAFGAEEGGPLSDEQVNSLVKYLTTDFRTEPVITNLVRAAVARLEPAPNSIVPATVGGISVTLEDKQTKVALASIILEVSGMPVLPVVVPTSSGALISHVFLASPAPGSRVPVRLTFQDDTGTAQVHEWSFEILDPTAARVLGAGSIAGPFVPIDGAVMENSRRCKVPHREGTQFFRLQNAQRIRSIKASPDAYSWILEFD